MYAEVAEALGEGSLRTCRAAWKSRDFAATGRRRGVRLRRGGARPRAPGHGTRGGFRRRRRGFQRFGLGWRRRRELLHLQRRREEKAAACKAVASYAHHCPNAFKTHIGAFLNPMGDMADYMHEMVRSQAHHALARMAQCALKAAPPPTRGFPDRRRLAQRDATRGARGRRQGRRGRRDGERGGGDQVRRRLGWGRDSAPRRRRTPQGPQRPLPRRAGGPAPCQEGDDEEHWAEEGAGDADDGDDPEEEDEEAELGQIVLEGVAELLPALAAVGGAEFAPHFQPHFAALMRRTSGTRPEGQRSVSYATIVEVVRAIGPAAAPVVPLALPGCCREFGAETAGLRRNTAYCAGVMVEVGGAAAAPHRLDVARALLPLSPRRRRTGGTTPRARRSGCSPPTGSRWPETPRPAPRPRRSPRYPCGGLEEAAATYGGPVSVFADAGAAQVLARWAPATVALFARRRR